MHRFFIPKSEIQGERLVLTGSEWHHCREVLRAKTGDRITVFDGAGREYLAEILEARSDEARLQLAQKSETPPPPCSITLAQALPKNKTMDFIVQKATELGIREIIPILSERSNIHLQSDVIAAKMLRWRQISIEAAKQCGLNWLPSISYPRKVREMADIRSHDRMRFIGSLQPDAKPLWDYLRGLKPLEGGILLMIGPEGDFTPAEINLVQDAGFKPLSLGPLALRCDTAAVYAISTLNYELRRSD
ncbi:MAG: 16S rRNA (uracil(1498)-N(3))-methyltransferase [Verrucomicrobia bacterium]|nr:16S rRNA (uracil(1498)-N(3))-methyltransferase [Verrucomicrobiota bacterium]